MVTAPSATDAVTINQTVISDHTSTQLPTFTEQDKAESPYTRKSE